MPVDHQNERPQSPTEGDDRTPDKAIGQVKYAAGQKLKKQGGENQPPLVPSAVRRHVGSDPLD